jgi:uncharacterized membrane protein
MADYLKIYFVALFTFLAIDFCWLALLASGFYQRHLGYLLANQPNWWAAVAFYLIFVLGVVVFSVLPALQASSLVKAFFLGGLFGLIAYATYDLTNQATIKNWPWTVTLVDLCWGTMLSASVGCTTFLVARYFNLTQPP